MPSHCCDWVLRSLYRLCFMPLTTFHLLEWAPAILKHFPSKLQLCLNLWQLLHISVVNLLLSLP